MRIGGGDYRGRILRTPRGDRTRPTSGLVRETLFNILAPELPEARILDLFAGCGSVGLEALSRGAAFATFVEKDRAAVECLRGNITTIGVEERTLVLPCPVERALSTLQRQGDRFDIIFLDPPFHDAQAYAQVLDALAESPLLRDGGVIVVQHGPRLALPESIGPLAQSRRREMGDNTLTFYRRQA